MSDELGGLAVEFGADLSGLESGISKAKEGISSVADTAEKTSSSFLGSIGHMTSGVFGLAGHVSGLVGGALSGIAGAAVSNFGVLKDQLSSVLQESIDAQAGMAQTEKVLQSTHDASGMTADAIANLAGDLSHLTKFSDDTTQAAENMLLTFTNIGKDVFPQATKTVLDMSQALGQDTKSSAIQLGKALNDPITGITALSRVGVTFDDQQKKLIQTYMDHNQVAKAQGVILQELQREFGGSAEAAGKTFGGQMVILNQYLDDFKQNIGDHVLPLVSGFLGILQKAPSYLDGIFHSLNLSDFTEAWKAVSTEVGSVFDRFKSLGQAIGTDGDPLANLLQKIMGAGLSTITDLLWDFSSAFIAIDKAVQSGDLGSILGDIFDVLGQAHSIIQTVEDDLFKFGAGLLDSALKSGALQSVLHTIHDLLPDVADFVKRVGNDLDNNLLPPLKGLIENVGTSVKNFSEWLDKSGTAKAAIGLLGDAVDKTSGFVGTLVGWVSDAVAWFNKGGPAADLVRDAILGIGGAIALIKLGDFVQKEVVGFIGKAKDAATAVQEWGGKMKDLGGNILDVAGKLKDQLVGAFQWAKDKIAGKGGATDEIGKGLDDVKQKEEDVGTTAKGQMASDVETGASDSEKSLKGIETEAGDVETAEEGIGTTAKEKMAPDVAEGSAEAEASIEGIATTADETAVQVEADAATMEGSLSGVLSSISAVGMAMAGINFGEGSANSSANNTLNDPKLQQEGRDEWKKVFGNTPMPDPSKMSADQLSRLYAAWQHDHPNEPFPFMKFGGGLASGGKNVAGGLYEIGEHGSEYMYVPGGSDVFPHGSSPVSAAGGSRQPVHIHIEVGGREVGVAEIDDIMNAVTKRMRLLHPGGRI